MKKSFIEGPIPAEKIANSIAHHKHKTNIGDNVFIGSDTMLIAPIKVGKGSTTAAGSILNSNIPSQTLAVTRVKEKHIPNWKRKPKK